MKTFEQAINGDNCTFLSIVRKFNPYHDERGRFASANGASSFTFRPGQSTAHDNAIAREKGKGFQASIAAAKASIGERDRWRVDVHDAKDYEGDKIHITPGGSTIAIEKDGNIVSVCKNAGDTGTRGSDLLKYAVENGGDRLDAFGPKLYDFYTKNGFEPVSYTEFNEKYAPEGWVKGVDKPEPVLFYKYTGKSTSVSYNDFLSSNKPFKDTADSDGYSLARAARDNNMGGE